MGSGARTVTAPAIRSRRRADHLVDSMQPIGRQPTSWLAERNGGDQRKNDHQQEERQHADNGNLMDWPIDRTADISRSAGATSQRTAGKALA
jgi:hypothetical protein